ncbi:hypothetical protein B0O99DRAFT_605498 [Bisporella sp. PMI_857]|nr:hypothetical protein B0O99DRAFT_605498 [Bisporella sp. PMI_857]
MKAISHLRDGYILHRELGGMMAMIMLRLWLCVLFWCLTPMLSFLLGCAMATPLITPSESWCGFGFIELYVSRGTLLGVRRR